MATCTLYRLDEHHEAFLAWKRALAGQACAARTLVHIDEHADFGAPDLREPLPQAQASTEEVARFVYRQLSIGTFLIPAALGGFFSELVWIRPSRSPRTRRRLYRLSRLPVPPYWAWRDESEPHDIALAYSAGGWRAAAGLRGPWMLDICLDAFACHARPVAQALKLEITARQYADMARAALNPWNARYGAAATVWIEEGRHFFGITDTNPCCDGPIDQDQLTKQIAQRSRCFESFLARAEREPVVITLVRSVRSGYTPAAVADRLEEQVLGLLGKAFPRLTERKVPGFG